MENWEKEHIRQNLVSLIDEINSSRFLSYMLQSNIISREENEELDIIGRNTGLTAQSKKLLDIIRGRTYGYQHLTKALYISKQTGPLITLLYGVQINTMANPFRYCQIELELGEFLQRKVSFLGHQVTLADICKNFNEVQLFSFRELIDVPIYKCLKSGDKITIAQDTIPSVLSYYINRTITLRNKLDTQVFKNRRQDYFLIQNIEPYQLTNLAQISQLKETSSRSNHFSRTNEENTLYTSVSSVQIRELNARFILLENEQHFDLICKRWESKSIHFIRFHDNTYFLEKSSNLQGIRHYLTDNELNIPENEFLKHTNNSGPVIIFDTPGMGKSALLTNLANQAIAQMPIEYVVYFEMQDFVNKLPDKSCDINENLIKEVILDTISTNKFGHFINRELIESRVRKFYIFLDAFDEVNYKQEGLAISVVKILSQHTNKFKIFITSRPHQGQNLESIFNVVGHGIHPFSIQEQINFLVDYWQKQYCVENSSEVQQFAKDCLSGFNSKTSSKDREITGIPLQCKMLADVYAKDVQTNSISFSNSKIVIDTIYDMYRGYFCQKFPNTFLIPGKSKLLDIHFKLALDFLFPRFSKTIVSWQGYRCEREIYSIGILECNKLGKEQFVHRTFAEFLVAEFVGNYIFNELREPKISKYSVFKFCFDEVFEVTGFYVTLHFYYLFNGDQIRSKPVKYKACKFKFPILAFFLGHFINFEIQEDRLPIFDKILQIENNLLSPKQCKEFLIASIENNSVGLYKLATNFKKEVWIPNLELYVNFREPFEKNRIQLYYSTITFPEITFLLASQFSSIDILKLHFDFISTLLEKSVANLNYEFKISGDVLTSHPVIYVAKRGDYHTFEYVFLNLKPDKALYSSVLFHCVRNSNRDEQNIVKGKLQILHFITNYYTIPIADFKNIFSFKNIHVELLLFLFGQGVNLFEKHYVLYTIVHTVVSYFSADSYHKLTVWLVKNNFFSIFKAKNNRRETPVHVALRKIELKYETLQILGTQCNVDFNERNENGETEFISAIQGCRSVDLLKVLVELGANVNTKDRSGCNALCHSIIHENIEALKYLLSLKLNPNRRCDFYLGNIWNHVASMGRYKQFSIPEIITLLKDNGADTSSATREYFEVDRCLPFKPASRYLKELYLYDELAVDSDAVCTCSCCMFNFMFCGSCCFCCWCLPCICTYYLVRDNYVQYFRSGVLSDN